MTNRTLGVFLYYLEIGSLTVSARLAGHQDLEVLLSPLYNVVVTGTYSHTMGSGHSNLGLPCKTSTATH